MVPASTGRWLHSAPLLIQGTEKELLPPLLPFCPHTAWLKAAKQVKFIVIQAKMAAAVGAAPVPTTRSWLSGCSHRWPQPRGFGCVAARGARMVPPAAWPRWPCWEGAQWPLSLPLWEAEEELSSLFSFWLRCHRGVANFPHWTANMSIVGAFRDWLCWTW